MTEPDDRDLEQYLAGASKLSRRYRDASTEAAPPELDELVLARARTEARRKPGLNRALTPLAVAASLLLGVNLAWRVYQTEPAPVADQAAREASGAKARALAGAPPREAKSPPAATHDEVEEIVATASRVPEPEAQAAAEAERDRAGQEAQQKREAELRESFAKQAEAQRRKAPDEAGRAAPVVDSAPAPAATAAYAPEPLTDAQKIDRLIAYVGRLEGAVFIRNGEEHSAPEAAKHLAYKRKKAGDRVKTPDDFIRLCASHSYVSKEAYLIRFADGRTRTAEDVLRDELARMEGLR